jgi:ketosteroid isomerase-like protein
MSLTESQKTEVQETMQQYATAYQKKDFLGLLKVFSPDICGYGSGPDEVILNHQGFVSQIRRDMRQATVNAVRFSDTKISGDGRVAWVMTRSSITFTVTGSKPQILQGRSTMVLRNTGSRWLIEQIHFSMPYSGQVQGQSFPGA